MTVSLTQALKLKNRIASELKSQELILKRENSRKINSTSKISVEKIYKKIRELKKQLAILKSEILKASVPIQYEIVYIGELRGLIANINTLSKVNGEVITASYSREPLREEYVAYLTEEKADEEIQSIQKEIDNLQDTIDGFNAKTNLVLKFETKNG